MNSIPFFNFIVMIQRINQILCKDVIEKNNQLLKENEDLKKKVVEIKQKNQHVVDQVNKYYKGKLRNLGINKNN